MARRIEKPKPSRINRSTTLVTAPDVSPDCLDLDGWPRSWRGLEKDLPPGEQLLAHLRPFLQHLVSSSLSPNTIRRHVDNLWLLGGELIRDLHYDPSLRKVAAERLLRTVIHEDGGPLIHNGSQQEQRSFDSTCRKLHHFLSQL